MVVLGFIIIYSTTHLTNRRGCRSSRNVTSECAKS